MRDGSPSLPGIKFHDRIEKKMLSNLFDRYNRKDTRKFEMTEEQKLIFQEGNTHYNEGKLDLALKSYEKALEAGKPVPDIYNNIGDIYLLKNNLEEAEKIFGELLEKYPDYAYGYYNYGLILQKKGDFKKALKFLNKAIKIEPHVAKFYNSLSAVYCDRTDFEKAISCLLKALKTDPHYIMAHINLSKIYLIRKEFNKALKHCEKAIKISPDNSAIYNQLGRIYQARGETDKAAGCYLKALDISPETVQLHYTLGELFEVRKLISKALFHYSAYLNRAEKDLVESRLIKELKDKIDRLKNTPEFYVEQGNVLLSKKLFEDAEKMWKKALEINPEFVPANVLLGALYEKRGHPNKAIKEYKRVLELKPEMEGIKKSLEELLRLAGKEIS